MKGERMRRADIGTRAGCEVAVEDAGPVRGDGGPAGEKKQVGVRVQIRLGSGKRRSKALEPGLGVKRRIPPAPRYGIATPSLARTRNVVSVMTPVAWR